MYVSYLQQKIIFFAQQYSNGTRRYRLRLSPLIVIMYDTRRVARDKTISRLRRVAADEIVKSAY